MCYKKIEYYYRCLIISCSKTSIINDAMLYDMLNILNTVNFHDFVV